MSRFKETPRFSCMNNEHMSVIFLVDTSGSVHGEPLRNINANLNRFKQFVCEDKLAANCVDVCVISFDDETRVIQDWVPVKEMRPIELTAGGMTDLGGAVLLAIDKERQRSRECYKAGISQKKPYFILLTDGGDNMGNLDKAAEEVTRRVREGKMKLFFLGFGDYDKTVAAKLTANDGWCFELKDGCYDFGQFFDFVSVSVRTASVSAAEATVNVETNIGTDKSNVKTIVLNDWLNS